MNIKSRIGGTITLLTGAVVIHGAFISLVVARGSYIEATKPLPPSLVDNWTVLVVIYFGFLAVVGFPLGILAILGGVYARSSNCWWLAICGALAATITFFPSGIVALVLIIKAKREFLLKKSTSLPLSSVQTR